VHCPPAMLSDVADVLATVRGWPGIVEKSPGVFYAHRQPFLHFHLADGSRRRADVKGRAGWTPLDLPRPISPARRRAFLALLRARYRETDPTARRSAARRWLSRRPGTRWGSVRPHPHSDATPKAGRKRRAVAMRARSPSWSA
jgi:hypothetical protein